MIISSGKIKYLPGKKYALWEDWWVQTPLKPKQEIVLHDRDGDVLVSLNTSGQLFIRALFPWDGASGPTRDVLKVPFTKPQNSMRGSLAHDALYLLERAGLIPQGWRDECDELLKGLCIQDGMWAWRATLWLWGVKNFAGYAAKVQPEEVLTAP